MAASMRYLIEKGRDNSCFEDMINHTQEEDKKTKLRLFRLMIRIDNIAKKLMDKDAHKMNMDDHNKFVEMQEKTFCEAVDMKQ